MCAEICVMTPQTHYTVTSVDCMQEPGASGSQIVIRSGFTGWHSVVRDSRRLGDVGVAGAQKNDGGFDFSLR